MQNIAAVAAFQAYQAELERFREGEILDIDKFKREMNEEWSQRESREES
ncbi:hypothetical protein M4951_01330 [Blastopirellula sp. J2-11]|nr:hypothetical protein [Blastopirellula sp. J2-11]UUO06967.1 hypothetical protein M4951_01330 [Blastopirellula sp. J2-11]